MDGATTRHAVDAELDALRARAYGPDPDIQDDPAALARLVELEAAHLRGIPATIRSDDEESRMPDAAPSAFDAAPAAAARAEEQESESASPVEASRMSAWQRLRTRPSVFWLAAGACVVLIAVACGVAWWAGPHPDATLLPTHAAPDDQLAILLMRDGGNLEIDMSTLGSYEEFRGAEPWSASDVYGNACLIVIERSTDRLVEAMCVPSEADPLADIEAWPSLAYDFAEGLPDGSVIRFQLRDETVDAFIHPARMSD